MKLTPGRFLGVPVKTRSVGGFVFTEYQYPAQARIRPHSHDLAYFSSVLSGSYVERCSQGHARRCDSGHVLYHPAGEIHSDVFGDRGGAIFSVELEPRWMETLREYDLMGETSVAFSHRVVSWLARRAYEAFTDSDQRSALRLESTAIDLLYELPWDESARAGSGTPHWLTDVVDILHNEFSKPFRLTAIARRVGAHPVQVARAFRRCQHMTVGQYVRRLRIDYAMRALQGADSIADIALRAGFADQSHLGRVFRAATGLTPRQFRLMRSKTETAF